MRIKKRCFTVLIIPHNEEHTFSFRLPLFVVQALVALFVLGIICFLVLINQYRDVLDQAGEARQLRETNRIQQQVIDRFADETQSLLEQMGPVEDLAEILPEEAEKLGIPVAVEEGGAQEENKGKETDPQES